MESFLKIVCDNFNRILIKTCLPYHVIVISDYFSQIWLEENLVNCHHDIMYFYFLHIRREYHISTAIRVVKTVELLRSGI